MEWQVENTDSDILPSPELMQGDLGLDISKDSELFAPTGIEEKQCENVATDQSDTTEDSEGKLFKKKQDSKIFLKVTIWC